MALNTLDLAGDQIDDVIGAVESVFALRFGQDDLVTVETVGDFCGVLRTRMKDGDGKCASSMAFYRIRRALRQLGGDQPIAPDTTLTSLSTMPPGKLLRQVEMLSGLRGLSNTVGPLALAGVGSFALGIVGLILAATLTLPWLLAMSGALVVLAFPLWRLDRGAFPNGVTTVGDLTRHAVARNHGSLILQGAAVRDDEIWASVRELVAEAADKPVEDVGRDTTFFKAAARAA